MSDETALLMRGWCDEVLDADSWKSLNNLTPREASMLLCQINPHNAEDDPLRISNDQTTPDDFKRLARAFEDIALSDPKERNLDDWLALARKMALKYHSWIDKYEFASQLPENPTTTQEIEESSDSGMCETGDEAEEDRVSIDEEIAALFDPVGVEQLEKMFPSKGAWKTWSAKAKEKGLIVARAGRAKYNPYIAAFWWMSSRSPEGWDWARCYRVLANNLPRRSMDETHRLIRISD